MGMINPWYLVAGPMLLAALLDVAPGPALAAGGASPPGWPVAQRTDRPCPPTGQYACFYRQLDYRGSSFCEPIGTARGRLGQWDGAVGSIWITAGAMVEACTRPNFEGDCVVFKGSVPRLQDAISSIRVR